MIQQIVYLHDDPIRNRKIPVEFMIRTARGFPAIIAKKVEYLPGFLLVDVMAYDLMRVTIPSDMISLVITGDTNQLNDEFKPR